MFAKVKVNNIFAYQILIFKILFDTPNNKAASLIDIWEEY
jgi:hypothetical protein